MLAEASCACDTGCKEVVMAQFESFRVPEAPDTEAIDAYLVGVHEMNLTELPTPKNDAEIERVPIPGATSWSALANMEADGFVYDPTDHTNASILRNYDDGLYNTHPANPDEISDDYKEVFWDRTSGVAGRLNPFGPTNLTGRFELWHHGARIATDSIAVTETDDGPYLLVVEKPKGIVLPGGFVNPEDGDTIMGRHVIEVSQESNGTVDISKAEAAPLHEGIPVANKRMTDTSWVESHAALFVLAGSNALKAGDSVDGDGEYEIETKYRWIPLDREAYDQLGKSEHRRAAFDAAIELGYISIEGVE